MAGRRSGTGLSVPTVAATAAAVVASTMYLIERRRAADARTAAAKERKDKIETEERLRARLRAAKKEAAAKQVETTELSSKLAIASASVEELRAARETVASLVGKTAPDFQSRALVGGEELRTVSLTDYAGRYLVLFFYPKDFSAVCPTEVVGFNDRLLDFAAADCEVLGCSTDSEYAHLAWAKLPRRLGGIAPLSLPLLSDISHSISAAYGVLLRQKGVALRGVFVIDRRSVVRHAALYEGTLGRSVGEVLRVVQACTFIDDNPGTSCPIDWSLGMAGIPKSQADRRAYFEHRWGSWSGSEGEPGDVSLSVLDPAFAPAVLSLHHHLPHDSVVCCAALAPNGALLATGSKRCVTLFDPESGEELRRLYQDETSPVLVPDAATPDSAAITPSEGVDPDAMADEEYVRSVAFSVDSSILACGGEDNNISLWRVADGVRLASLAGHTAPVMGVAFSPAGTGVLASGGGDSVVRLWDTDTSYAEIACLDVAQDTVTSVSFNHDGSLLAAGSMDHSVYLIDMASNKVTRQFVAHQAPIYTLAWTPLGARADVLITGSLDGRLRVWTPRGACLAVLAGHKSYVLTVTVSRCGRYLLSGGKDFVIMLWDLNRILPAEPGPDPVEVRPVLAIKSHRNSVIALSVGDISAQGGFFVSGGGDECARVWKISGLPS